MKNAGLLILAIGVSLAALYGARVTPDIDAQLTAEGRAKFRGEALEAAHGAYCEARTHANLPAADGCGEEAPTPGAPAEGATLEARVAHGREQLATLRATTESLSGEVAEKREAWLAAFEADIEPAAAAAVLQTPGPEARLEAWFSQSGLMFLLGLALIFGGAIMARIAVRREATAEDGEAGGARDFGKVLGELTEKVGALAERAKAIEAPKEEDFEALKQEVEGLQLEGFEPLVAARARVQAKYGLAGFADLFGPLSSSERKVNRTWSALVDRHFPEARSSLEDAATDIAEARDILARLASAKKA